jgi:hypothetical protein
MFTEKEIRRAIREELRTTLVRYKTRSLNEQPKDEEASDQSDTGGASVALIKKGLVLAFPDWADDIQNVELKSSFVDEFAGLIKNALSAAESGDLVKAQKASDMKTSQL